eukprot:TRINITY_DN3286_c0_g1_i2.p1 TRINITY_DN3286_c0_g1~~TRINITY_DN3286_c0_g1_i2.p1  ORF type:complete len:244 (-),score=80.79 TRINITY_DN3286_c0_g1_i2:177-875(-)
MSFGGGTLADELLNDSDDEMEQVEIKKEEEDDDDNDEVMGPSSIDDDLEAKLRDTVKSDDIYQVATLISSDRYKSVFQRVQEKIDTGAPMDTTGLIEDNPEYHLIVESNALVTEINNEITIVHKFLRDRYAKKFPELESLVLNPLDYARVVRRIGNQTDMAHMNLADIIPAATVMIVSTAASITTGSALEDDELSRVFASCDMCLSLDECRTKVFIFLYLIFFYFKISYLLL